MATSLPKKLIKEPLIDAVFEVRFSSKAPASVILPGLLFSNLDSDNNIESLPISELPKAIREANPQLRFAPLSRVNWGQFYINIGDTSVSVSCKYPYSGWSNFKTAIHKVVGILSESKIVEEVHRYSMKYVDMIPSSNDQQKISMINFKVSIADHSLEKEPFQLRIEIPRDGLTNIVQVVSSAQAIVNGSAMEGLVVDVDTIADQGGISMQSLLEGFEDKLESIHLTNKAMFFDCLTPQAIALLEPVYE